MPTRSRSPYLSSAEVAEVLGISPRTLDYWIHNKKIETPKRQSNGRFKWTLLEISVLKQQIREGVLKVKKDSRRKTSQILQFRAAS